MKININQLLQFIYVAKFIYEKDYHYIQLCIFELINSLVFFFQFDSQQNILSYT